MSVFGRSINKVISRPFSKISKESVYFESIRDLRKLDTYTRDKILHQTYTLSLTSLIAFSFEQYVSLCMDPSKKEIRFLLMKERRFDTLIGYSFYPVHELHLTPNDSSHANKYISTLNPIMYEYRTQISDLVTPNPLKPKNSKLDHLLDRLIEDLGHPRNQEHPLVRVFPGAYLVGVDYENSLKNIEKASEQKKFFLKVTQGRPDWALFNVAVFNLVQDNTLGLSAGEYSRFPDPDFDVFELGSNKPINLTS